MVRVVPTNRFDPGRGQRSCTTSTRNGSADSATAISPPASSWAVTRTRQSGLFVANTGRRQRTAVAVRFSATVVHDEPPGLNATVKWWAVRGAPQVTVISAPDPRRSPPSGQITSSPS